MDVPELTMPRVQEVVLPILRSVLDTEWPGIKLGSWVEDVKHRTYPVVNIRRLGGLSVDPFLLDRAVIEMTVYHNTGLIETERIYNRCKSVLWFYQQNQIVVPGVGYIHSFFETMGPIPLDSPYDDTWRVQGLIQLGLRPPND